MKRLMMILAGAVLAVGIAQMPAHAATYNLHNIPDNGSKVSFGGKLGTGTFSDTIKFHLDAASKVTGFLVDLPVTVFGVALADLNHLKIFIDGTQLSLNANSGGVFSGAVLDLLGAGNHKFTITGKAIGLFGGAYSFGVAASAVTPIPPALLMFGTALGGLGFVGWRRRQAMAA